MAFIRPYEPKDAEDCKYICRATLPPSLSSSPQATAMSPYLWTLQFLHLSPSTCFVLDDGQGKVVGYVIGTPDVFDFADNYHRYVSDVLQSPQGLKDVPPPKQLDVLESWTKTDDGTVNPVCLAQTAYKVEWLVLDGVEGKRDLVEKYRAMMHIDLLEGYQGKGWGKKMIERFVESVKGSNKGGVNWGKGIQIGVAGENTKVVKFYEKVGFRVYPGGEREGNVWMVRDL
ncbi:acyl-CoA N-acyltransferase [Cladorrhinum sp. PSN259]|nr:acyl-CoA N-acyltransferase [Cladorrhinum sp. PSN259]